MQIFWERFKNAIRSQSYQVNQTVNKRTNGQQAHVPHPNPSPPATNCSLLLTVLLPKSRMDISKHGFSIDFGTGPLLSHYSLNKAERFSPKNELLDCRRRNDFTQMVHVFFLLSENLPNRSFPFLLWNLRNHLSWCDDWSDENVFWVWTGKLYILRGDFSNVVNVYLTCIHKLHL